MPDKLATVGGGGLSRVLTPEVRTLAKPSPTPLIGARGVVHRTPALKAVFEQAKREGWTPEQLAGAITPDLETALDCSPEQSVEAAQYLADEYFQLGDAVLLCDRTTGKAIARISDADMYQPPPQRRHGSTELAPSLPRLNPNLEGFLVSYIFEQERDAQVRREALAALPQSAFLADSGDDPRVRAVTRAGRLGIAENVRAALPDVLEAVQGSARVFLGYFELVTEAPPHLTALPRQTAESTGRVNIVDPKAMNARFSWEATIRARTGVGWVREMATHLVNDAQKYIRHDLQASVPLDLLTHEHIDGRPFWTGDPATIRALSMVPRPPGIVPFTGFPCPTNGGVLGLSGPGLGFHIGAIQIHPDTYEFSTREVHLRWEMIARMEYTLYVNWDYVQFLQVTDIPIHARAEIVR
jgi:hypothetical protein